jgi:hypothetical protein
LENQGHTFVQAAVLCLWNVPLGEVVCEETAETKNCIRENLSQGCAGYYKENCREEIVEKPVGCGCDGIRMASQMALFVKSYKTEQISLTGNISEQMVQGCEAKPIVKKMR